MENNPETRGPSIVSFFRSQRGDNECNSESGGQLSVSQVQLNTLPGPQSSHRTRTPSHFANIFRVKASSGERRQRITVRYEQVSPNRSKKTTQQKIEEVNNFVKRLTEFRGEEIPQITDTKFKALKKIIEYYDIKNLDHSEYSNVIKSFGLQIGTIKAEQRTTPLSEEHFRKRKAATSLMNRTQHNFKRKKEYLPDGDPCLTSKELAIHSPSKGERNLSPKRIQEGHSLFNSFTMRKNKLKEQANRRQFKFKGGDNCIREKVNRFREFLFAVNYSNKVYRQLDVTVYEKSLKFYVGRGNNANLLRSLMKRRFWFQEVSSDKVANFVWTQIKRPALFKKQQQTQTSFIENKSKRKDDLCKNESLKRILNADEVKEISFLQDSAKTRGLQTFEERLKFCKRKLQKQQMTKSAVILNHFPSNGLLGNKKAMFCCLRQYYNLIGQNIFTIVPLTFIITHGVLDPEYNKVAACFSQRKNSKTRNYWILKPGEFSNCGKGIECTNKLQDVKKRLMARKKGSLIVQEYISRPLLYNGRKFDIRTYMLLTYQNGVTKGYWYQQGYVRTASYLFNLGQLKDPYVHLTNDAVQVNDDNYGRFEPGNKLSYSELQRYLESLGKGEELHQTALPIMKKIAANTVKATFLQLNKQGRDKNFEIYGLDFMLDEWVRPWLIEVNTNPCLDLSTPILARLIPYMVENALRIGLDSIFPPPQNFSNNDKYNIPQNALHYNKFQLIFDSQRQGAALARLWEGHQGVYKQIEGLQQDKNEYKQEGQMITVDNL